MDSYWLTEEAHKVIQGHEDFPEGWIPLKYLQGLYNEFYCMSIFDFGCGNGRMSEAFPVDDYFGYDPNPLAIEQARKNNPGYRYSNYLPTEIVSGMLLAYTVFLHLTDDEVREIIGRCYAEYIIIAEVTGHAWRRPGNPPVYNREISEYVEMLSPKYKLLRVEEKDYIRYKGAHGDDFPLKVMVFERG